MSIFCRDTRHLAPEQARGAWLEARVARAALLDRGRPVDGWTITGIIYEREAGQSDAARRLARYRAFGCGGTAGRENFLASEKDQAAEMLRTLLSVARSDPKFRALVGPEARAERQRVWAV
jgi:hypothetical protein